MLDFGDRCLFFVLEGWVFSGISGLTKMKLSELYGLILSDMKGHIF